MMVLFTADFDRRIHTTGGSSQPLPGTKALSRVIGFDVLQLALLNYIKKGGSTRFMNGPRLLLATPQIVEFSQRLAFDTTQPQKKTF